MIRKPDQLARFLTSLDYPPGEIMDALRQQFPRANARKIVDEVRAEAAREATRVTVYLPREGTFPYSSIDPGSGVVGRRIPDPHGSGEERLVIYYEGGRYASNIVTFADRCHHAAGRMLENYPTSAMMAADGEDLTRIGSYDTTSGVVGLDGQLELLALVGWLTRKQDTVDLGAELRATHWRARAAIA